MKIIYFGSSGPLSTLPLLQLLSSGHTICAVAVDHVANNNPAKTNNTIPIFDENTGSIATLAIINNIPIIELSNNINDHTQTIASHAPDIIIVSCFGRKIPEQICNIPRLGSFNLHPSLLPEFRGPTPLFWQFRAGIENFGITMHRLSQQWDTGNIINQIQVEILNGISHLHACQLLAYAGSDLIETSLQQLHNHTISEIAQSNVLSNYQGPPEAADFIVSNQWPAQRVYNFICGTRNWAKPYPCQINNHIYQLVNVISFSAQGLTELQIKDNQIKFPCLPGYVTALLLES